MNLRKIVRWPARILIQFLAKRSERFSVWFGRLMMSRSFDKKLISYGFKETRPGVWVKKI